MLYYLTPLVAVAGFAYYKNLHKKLAIWATNKALNYYIDSHSSSDNEVSLNASNNGRYLELNFVHLGKKQVVLLPFDYKKVVAMSQYKVELLYDDKPLQNITQQPGVPYLLSANDLECKSILVTNEDNGMVHEYTEDEIPMYAAEVQD